MALPSVRVCKQNKTKSDKQNLSRNKKLAENKAASNLHGPTEQDLDQDLGPDCDPRLPTKKKGIRAQTIHLKLRRFSRIYR